MPGTQRVTIGDAGHTPALENPQAFVDATLPFLHGVGCKPWTREKAAARAELLHLHDEVIRFHLEDDVDSWMALDRPVQLIANRGNLLFPTAEQTRARRESYLGAVEFSTYRDLVPPVVRLADDLSMGWLMTQVEVEGHQPTPDGDVSFRWVWAWISLFDREADGSWRFVGNVSNAQPPPD